jgi:hypothetical protein
VISKVGRTLCALFLSHVVHCTASRRTLEKKSTTNIYKRSRFPTQLLRSQFHSNQGESERPGRCLLWLIGTCGASVKIQFGLHDPYRFPLFLTLAPHLSQNASYLLLPAAPAACPRQQRCMRVWYFRLSVSLFSSHLRADV